MQGIYINVIFVNGVEEILDPGGSETTERVSHSDACHSFFLREMVIIQNDENEVYANDAARD